MSKDDNNGRKGPWGSRGSNNNGTGNSSGGNHSSGERPNSGDDMPDIDELLRQAQDSFGSFFGGGKKSSSGGSTNGGKLGFGLIFILVIALWLGTGFYRVAPEENAVILTFGKWTTTVGDPGLGYHIPWPVQEAIKVNVAFERRVEIGFREKSSRRTSSRNPEDIIKVESESQMLTGDENIVDIHFVVMWKISNAKEYLFEIRNPKETIKKVAESAMREIIGQNKIQSALTEGRSEIEAQAKILMQQMLDDYKSGVAVNNVQLLRVDPPATVVDAFDDVQRARADKERTKNESQTYSNDIIPRARGASQKLLQDAEAYKEAVISKAKGEAGRFLSVYNAYKVSKKVTKERLYIETMQEVMSKSKKIIVGKGGSGTVLPYLSLDQLKSNAKNK